MCDETLKAFLILDFSRLSLQSQIRIHPWTDIFCLCIYIGRKLDMLHLLAQLSYFLKDETHVACEQGD